MTLFSRSFSTDYANRILTGMLEAGHGISISQGEADRGHKYDPTTKSLQIDPRASRKEDDAKLDILCACLPEILPADFARNIRITAARLPALKESLIPELGGILKFTLNDFRSLDPALQATYVQNMQLKIVGIIRAEQGRDALRALDLSAESIGQRTASPRAKALFQSKASEILSGILGAQHGISVIEGAAGRGHEYDRETQSLKIDPLASIKAEEMKLDILCACLPDILYIGTNGRFRTLIADLPQEQVSRKLIPLLEEAVRTTYTKKRQELSFAQEVPSIQMKIATCVTEIRENDALSRFERARDLHGESLVAEARRG